MKLLTIPVTILFLASSAFALNKSTSWPEIFNNKNAQYSTEYPVIGRIGLNNVCMDGSEIKSIKPVAVCTAFGIEMIANSEDSGMREFVVCKETGYTDISVSREFEKQACTEYTEINDGENVRYECAQYTSYMSTIPSVIEVTVWEDESGSESRGSTWPGFMKLYTIPDCN